MEPSLADQQAPQRKVSVVIASLRCPDAVRRCLRSLLSGAAAAALETFVVDCGSFGPEESPEGDFPGVTLLRLPRNFGLTKARNIGIRSATTDFVLFLSPYAELSAASVLAMHQRLESDEETAAVCPLPVDETGRPMAGFRPLPVPERLRDAWKGCPGGQPVEFEPGAREARADYPPDIALLVRKRFLKGMNYLDDRYGEFGAHEEICYQVHRASRKLVVLADATVVFHATEAGRLPEAAGARALLSADFAHGAAIYIAKRWGLLPSLGFRLGAVLTVLYQLVTLREPGYNLSRLIHLLSDARVDGSQSGW